MPKPKSKSATDRVLADLLKKRERCFIDGDFIVMKIRNDVLYEIALDSCNTHAKIIGWQMQLAAKRWATKERIMQFTLLACERHNLPIARL